MCVCAVQAGALQADMQAATEAFWQIMQVQAAVVEDLQKQNEDVARGVSPNIRSTPQAIAAAGPSVSQVIWLGSPQLVRGGYTSFMSQCTIRRAFLPEVGGDPVGLGQTCLVGQMSLNYFWSPCMCLLPCIYNTPPLISF